MWNHSKKTSLSSAPIHNSLTDTPSDHKDVMGSAKLLNLYGQFARNGPTTCDQSVYLDDAKPDIMCKMPSQWKV